MCKPKITVDEILKDYSFGPPPVTFDMDLTTIFTSHPTGPVVVHVQPVFPIPVKGEEYMNFHQPPHMHYIGIRDEDGGEWILQRIDKDLLRMIKSPKESATILEAIYHLETITAKQAVKENLLPEWNTTVIRRLEEKKESD